MILAMRFAFFGQTGPYAPHALRHVLAHQADLVGAELVLVVEGVRDPLGRHDYRYEKPNGAAKVLPAGENLAELGLAAGLIGAGGAFLLVPMLLVVVGIPIRVTIGSSLAITAVSALTGFAGKLATGQVPWLPAVMVVLGAVPGAQLGAWLSRRLSGRRLKQTLFVVVLLTSIRVWWDLLSR